MELKKDLVIFSYTSIWALVRAFPSIFENGTTTKYFNNLTVCGRESSREEAIQRLDKDISEIRGQERGENKRVLQSQQNLRDRLNSGRVGYFNFITNGTINLPDGYYDAAIFTKNTIHHKCIEVLLKHGNINIICEKPLVVLTDETHKADDKELEGLEGLVKQYGDGLVLIDAEHYSAKEATIAFYDNLELMSSKYGQIKDIESRTLEKDDSLSIRTQNLLCIKNRTGLLLDMGVHLFGIITNIKGEVHKIEGATYDKYQGYNVETHAEVEFKLRGDYFTEDAKGRIKMTKFIDKLKEQKDEQKVQDEKKFIVTFFDKQTKKETTVTLDFRKGTAISSDGEEFKPKMLVSPNEYDSIFKEFYECIAIKRKDPTKGNPRTCFDNSIRTLRTIYEIYKQFPVEKK